MLDQPLLGQQTQSLPQRCPADLEPLSQLLLDQPFTGLQCTRQDLGPKPGRRELYKAPRLQHAARQRIRQPRLAAAGSVVPGHAGSMPVRPTQPAANPENAAIQNADEETRDQLSKGRASSRLAAGQSCLQTSRARRVVADDTGN
jgi:hypothetical protein